MMNHGRLLLSSMMFSLISMTTYANFDATKLENKQINFQSDAQSALHISSKMAAKLKEINQQQLNALQDLRTSIANSKTNLSDSLTSKLDKLIAKRQFNLTQPSEVTANKNAQINFLNLQLIDAFTMLSAVQTSIKSTLTLAKKMRELAIIATRGDKGTEDLKDLNYEFQRMKQHMSYVQTVDLVNGKKNVAGGSIKIRFGNDENDSTTLIYEGAKLDLTTLGIDADIITSNTTASTAINNLDTAIDRLTHSLAVVNDDVIEDGKMALLVLRNTLSQDFELYDIALNIALQATNGTSGTADLYTLNTYFDLVKLTLNKIQTYSSLYSPKMLGGGKVKIQVGANEREDTTLIIDFPVTDVKKLGLDQQDVLSNKRASAATDAVLTYLHDFVYGKKLIK